MMLNTHSFLPRVRFSLGLIHYYSLSGGLDSNQRYGHPKPLEIIAVQLPSTEACQNPRPIRQTTSRSKKQFAEQSEINQSLHICYILYTRYAAVTALFIAFLINNHLCTVLIHKLCIPFSPQTSTSVSYRQQNTLPFKPWNPPRVLIVFYEHTKA